MPLLTPVLRCLVLGFYPLVATIILWLEFSIQRPNIFFYREVSNKPWEVIYFLPFWL